MKATNQTIQRSFNRSLVLQKVRSEGRVSRVDLSRAVGLEKSSITAIVGELVDKGLLVEAEVGASTSAVGRKPVFLRLNEDFCCLLGIEIQPARYHAVVLNLGGVVLHQESGPLEAPDRPFETKLAEVYTRLGPVIAGLKTPLAALCVGLPGLVDPQGNRVHLSVPHDLRDWPFETQANPWGVPAFVENDANCCAWATLMDGDPTDGGDFLALLLEFQDPNPRIGQDKGVSLGFGVVLNGELHYGHNFEAGEFRSVFWKKGRRSQTGIDDKALEHIARDPLVLDEYLEELLVNLVPICSILAPERILLCGEAGRAHQHIQALLAGPLADSWLGVSGLAGRFEPSPRASEAVAVGAAARILMTLFNSRSLSKTAQTARLDWEGVLGRFGRP